MKKIVLFLVFALALKHDFFASETVLKKVDNKWQLLVDGKPFVAKGATFGVAFTKETIGSYMRDLKSMGVNTIRTWGTNDETQLLLDSANAYGIKVMLGIWMRHGRSGMEGDDNFDYLNDTKGMQAMMDDALASVKKYKNHPALLFFGVGNEVTLNIATDPEKEAYAKFLETVIQAMKKIDSKHPVASVSAWTFDWEWWKKYTPSLDIYGINVYGGGANQIPDEMTKLGVDKAYIICEYGVNGEWEAKPDKNGLLIEPNDKQKYDVIASGYKDWIASKASCLGVYVFHYGNGTEHGSVWLSMYFGAYFRPAYWATREAYTGQKPKNYIPNITTFTLPDTKKASGEWIPIDLKVTDVENDSLTISFHYNQRTGSRVRKDQINALEFRKNPSTSTYEILLPKENGLIKVYVYVKDSFKNIGIAQTSYIIDNGENSETFIPGAKVNLPFYVYDEGKKYAYIPSAYMGDFQYLNVDGENKEEAYLGEKSMKFNFTNTDGWYGIGFVDPPDDWGEKAGGFCLTGAKKLTFWAKANSEHIRGTCGFGMINDDKPFYDTGKKSEKFRFTTEWKKYEIDLTDLDLRCIKTGFILYFGGIGEPYSFWLDEIRYE